MTRATRSMPWSRKRQAPWQTPGPSLGGVAQKQALINLAVTSLNHSYRRALISSFPVFRIFLFWSSGALPSNSSIHSLFRFTMFWICVFPQRWPRLPRFSTIARQLILFSSCSWITSIFISSGSWFRETCPGLEFGAISSLKKKRRWEMVLENWKLIEIGWQKDMMAMRSCVNTICNEPKNTRKI